MRSIKLVLMVWQLLFVCVATDTWKKFAIQKISPRKSITV